jgi:hypothetical protein
MLLHYTTDDAVLGYASNQLTEGDQMLDNNYMVRVFIPVWD